jgi:DHA2 family lincomycin resistance protein-like MFS transporter
MVAAFAAFLATFNETFLNVAFSPIMADFDISIGTVQWLATAYMLGAAVMVPVSAFAYRSLPTRPLFVAVMALFVVGSVIGALAPTFTVLLVGRIVQALGTGLLIPIGMNITLEVAPRAKLGTYMGVMGAMTTLGPSSSVMIAGVMLNSLHWKSLLWLFAALSLLCLLFGVVFLRDIATLTKPKLDVASVILVGLGLVGVLYAISTAFSGSLVIAACALIVGAICVVAFVRRQGQLEQPLIDLRPLSVKPFRIGVVINMISLLTIFAMNIIIPMFMQSVLGLNPLIASLILFPAIAASCIISPIAGRLSDKHGPIGLLVTGFTLIAIFTAALSILITTGSTLALALLYVPVIGGSALIIGPVQSYALSRLAPEAYPHGVTIMSTGFQIAGCIGSSLMTGIYAGVTALAITSGEDATIAAGTGFLIAGLVTAAFAVAGLILAIRLRSHAKATPTAVDNVEEISDLSRIMKTEVFALAETDRVVDALRLLVSQGISGAPVVGPSGNVVGFVSDGDVMRYLRDQHPAFKNAWSFVAESGNDDFNETLAKVLNLPITELAHRHVISVDVNAEISAVCGVLADHHLRKIPVTSQGRMVGIINRSNVIRYAVESYLAQVG